MLGGYAAYILPAYLLSALVIGVLWIWTVLAHRRMRRQLTALEDQGHRRRSSSKPPQSDD